MNKSHMQKFTYRNIMHTNNPYTHHKIYLTLNVDIIIYQQYNNNIHS